MSNLAIEGQRIQGLSAGTIRAALKKSNPRAAASDLSTMAEIMAAVSNVLAELPKADRSELARETDDVRRILIEAASHGRTEPRISVRPSGRIERSRGAGLGEQIPVEEGRNRLAGYATARALESWAGPVAGAGEIEATLGIPRSTLSHWQQKGVIVGLLRGARKLAYPLEQFVDARPLEGLADILEITPDARSAWLWLRQPHGALEGRAPLEQLKAGARSSVLAVAQRDFH